MSRGIHGESTTRRLEVARAARNDRVLEVIYLLSILTKVYWSDSHLAVVDMPGQTTMNHVVCCHVAGERLVWRISDFEALEYFAHLQVRQDCPRGLPRDGKMAVLAELAHA